MSETEPNVCEFCGQTLLDGRQCDCDAAMTHRSRLEAVDDAIYCIENMRKCSRRKDCLTGKQKRAHQNPIFKSRKEHYRELGGYMSLERIFRKKNWNF